MKRIILLFIIIAILLIPINGLAAEQNIQILVDGEKVITDTSPIISSDRVLVPIRVVSEALGYSVIWNAATKEVIIHDDTTTLKLIINEPAIWRNGIKSELDVAPMIVNNRTMLPIRAVAENLNTTVDWDNATKTVIINTIEPEPPRILTSIEQSGTSFTLNYTNASVPLEKSVFTLSNPERIVIDLENMILVDGTSIPSIEDNDYIEGIRYSQYNTNPNKVRVVIDLKQPAKYSLSQNDNSITLDLRSPEEKIVVIDPGHGGRDPGAISVTGRYEKDLNLAIALKVAAILEDEQNLTVKLTRNDDTYVTLDNRVAFANNLNADLYLSIHANALSSRPEIGGTETYYTRADSLEFARLVHKNLVATTGFNDRGVRYNDFRVTKYTTMPAALIEVGFLTNSVEEKTMYDPNFQQKVAESLVAAIKEYLSIGVEDR